MQNKSRLMDLQKSLSTEQKIINYGRFPAWASNGDYFTIFKTGKVIAKARVT